MLPGITGTLLAPSFLEQVVSARLDADLEAVRAVHAWWRRVGNALGPAASARKIADAGLIPLLESRSYRVLTLDARDGGLVGAAGGRGGARVALRVASWGSDLEQEWRATVRAGRQAGARWGLVFSGDKLRIVDAGRTWSRRALEIDLAAALATEPGTATLLLVLDAAGAAAGATLDDLATASEQHGVTVCAALGAGVLEALSEIFAELAGSRREHRDPLDAFQQAVTIVYRLLFLLFAEARALVPTWHHVYRDGYTIDALCRRMLIAPSRRGAWKAVQAISRLAHQGCRAGELVVTPFNGRLFSPRHTLLAEDAQVSDVAVGKAIVALATTRGRGARERIAYADLGVEQLGAVYERVLEYEPSGDASGRAQLTRTSLDRKTSGSFYTPRSVTDFLVRRALHPVVTGKRAEDVLRLRILDPAMGSGAFLVAACRYLTDVVERGLISEGELPPDRSAEQHSAIRRQVVRRCLFGVDVNPMAVQLARLSLWLASLSADRPLTFLDHHLAAGDSLLGASLADLARDPLISRARREASHPLFDAAPDLAMSQQILPARLRLALQPDDTAAAVREKEVALANLSAAGAPLAQLKDAAHLWCAPRLWDSTPGAGPRAGMSRGVYRDTLAALLGGGAALPAGQRELVLQRARRLADTHRFFHWQLEFPEVFFGEDGRPDPNGGFDVVLGNPPWDVIRADTGTARARDAARRDHRSTLRFFRESGVYQHQGRGHLNRYQLFVERALQLLKPGGRLALIAPSGLVTDHGSADLRRALLTTTQVDRIIGFDNRRAIFPIHRDVRFLLLTATAGMPTERVVCRFGESDPLCLDQLPDSAADDPPNLRAVAVSRTALESWDPEHLSIPWLTSAADLEIVSRISATVPSLGQTGGWDVRFGRELNATDDRQHFVARAGRDHLPVIEGKHLEPFRLVAGSSRTFIPAARAATLADPARTYARARVAYRDVASATNRLTLIAARLPVGTISTHTVFCSKDALGEDAQYCLVSLLNSLVANYLVRLRVTTHVTTAIMSRLRVPRPPSRSDAFQELAKLGRALERTGVTGHDEQFATLNAICAQLYGLTSEEYAHVVGTFPLLPPALRARCVASAQP